MRLPNSGNRLNQMNCSRSFTTSPMTVIAGVISTMTLAAMSGQGPFNSLLRQISPLNARGEILSVCGRARSGPQ